jgi:hypothetical protein
MAMVLLLQLLPESYAPDRTLAITQGIAVAIVDTI